MNPGTRLGPYEIIAQIGAGGMGEVYRAHDPRLARDVAIKVSAAQFTERFEREARAVAALNHPNVCTLHDVGPNYIVMEYVEGESPRGPLPLDEVLRLGRQITNALEAAHEKGIIHRDLKPANLKIKPDGTVKVLDFGLAKQTQSVPEGEVSNSPTLSAVATQAGIILGTAAYMSPEQARGRAADKRADIWAFGVVLYELLTGEQLFKGEDITETLASVVKDQPALNKVPMQVRRLLKRCLEKDPTKRLRDIGDVWALLEEPSGTTSAVPSRSRLSIWAFASAGILAAALVTLAFVHFRETPPSEETLRFAIPWPENAYAAPGFRLAVSPNGRYVVVSPTVNGRRQLWLRRLDSLEMQPVPGTDDAASPFWSPDSRWIGFFAAGKLRKIAVAGGPSQPICDVNAFNAAGGTWNRDDMIVFSPGPGENVLRRVSAAGGPVSDVTTDMQPAVNPVFLPEGRHLLYTVPPAVSSPEKSGTYLISLDGQERRRLLPEVGTVGYAPSRTRKRAGYILFVRESNLMAQPLDENTLQTTSDAIPIVEAIGSVANYRPVSVSTNGVLVYLGQGAAGTTNQIVWYDRTGKSVELVGDAGNVWNPSLSPDGKSIAFAKFGNTGEDIWLRDLDHKVDQRFTADPSQNDAPVWSPNGDRIVFRSTRTGRQELWSKAVNGSGKEEMIPTDANNKFASQFSPDGRYLVYTDNSAKGKTDIWYMPLEGSRKPQVFLQTEFDEAQGQISPDGHWMAYSSEKTGQREVYVAPFPPGEGEWRISTSGGDQPRWRRSDGKELYYVAKDGKMMSVTVRTAAGPKPSFDRDKPVPLFDTKIAISAYTRALQYDVAPDGKRFLVNTNSASPSSTAIAPLTAVVNWWPK